MLKRNLSKLLMIALMLSMLSGISLPSYAAPANWLDGISSTTATWDSGGSIGSAAELAQFCYNVNNGKSYSGQTIIVTTDVDLSGKEWTPIGKTTSKFSGTFNGQGYTISNMSIASNFVANGLFGNIDGATISNLSVSGSITVGGSATAGIAAWATDNPSTIENCRSSVDINVSTGAVGGITGYADSGKLSITNCCNTGNITSTNNGIGGIAGVIRQSVTNCYNTGNISGYDHVGGIAGQADAFACTVANCYNIGTVSGNGNIGGIAGLGAANISHCVALNQSITGSSNFGRVLGNVNSVPPQYTYSWDGMTVNGSTVASADPTSKNGADVGKIQVNQSSNWTAWFSDFSTNWEMPAGQLPNLKVFTADNVAMPAYLALASDATLSGLSISSGTLSPIFASGTTSYTVDVANAVTSITVTPTVNDANATVKVNGTSVASGTASGDIALNVGSNTITVLVTAQDSVTTKTYTIAVTRTAAASNTQPVAEVNGALAVSGTISTTKINDQITTTATLNQASLFNQLAQSDTGTVVTIPFSRFSDTIVVVLNGQMVKDLEDNGAVLVVRTQSVSYKLSAEQLDIASISEELGADGILCNIKVCVRISYPTDETVQMLQLMAGEQNLTLIVPAVSFDITCTYSGKTMEVNKFSTYVERMIAIPEDADPSMITTGIVVNPDGTTGHVPTKITEIDGVHYAVINSLTNSTYSVIWHPYIFSDVENHWAKDAINDMGSRMIVFGDENCNFNPDNGMTRAEFAATIAIALGLTPGTGENGFDDVSVTDWYCGYVETATAYGIIYGYGNGSFGPNDLITREQAMAMIARAMNITGLVVDLTESKINELLGAYLDGTSVSDYAVNSIAACLQTGIVIGKSDKIIVPQEYITRAEVAVMTRRLLQKSGLI